MRCSYCFYKELSKGRDLPPRRLMDQDTLSLVIGKALSYSTGSCTIAFQGGEPTLAGLGFFESVIRYQNQYNVNNVIIKNTIQTNGYDLGEKWAAFFSKHDFLVGVSLDGTRESHNSSRKDRHGGETFSHVLKTIHDFKKHKVSFNILTVINANTARKAEDIYRFYKRSRFEYIQFIPCLDPFGAEPVAGHSLTPVLFEVFLKTLFDIWYKDVIDGEAIRVNLFENYIAMLLGFPPETCGSGGTCSYQNIVEADGVVYPCDFYALDSYSIGNLLHNDFDEINQRRKELQFIEYSGTVNEKCKECGYFKLCRGGCRRHRESVHGEGLRLNIFCDAYHSFFEYAIDRLQVLARRILPISER